MEKEKNLRGGGQRIAWLKGDLFLLQQQPGNLGEGGQLQRSETPPTGEIPPNPGQSVRDRQFFSP